MTFENWLAERGLVIRLGLDCDEPCDEPEEFFGHCYTVRWVQHFDDPSVGLYAGALSPLFRTEAELEAWCYAHADEMTA